MALYDSFIWRLLMKQRIHDLKFRVIEVKQMKIRNKMAGFNFLAFTELDEL